MEPACEMTLVIARLRWAREQRVTDSATLAEFLQASSISRWIYVALRSTNQGKMRWLRAANFFIRRFLAEKTELHLFFKLAHRIALVHVHCFCTFKINLSLAAVVSVPIATSSSI